MMIRNTILSIFLWLIIPSVVLAQSPRATILLYQGLTEGCPEDMNQKRKDRFYNDMLYIKANFDVISLLELQDIIENQKKLSRNTVVITFDQGLKSDYTIAKPVLEEFGFPATFFIATGLRENEDYMSWEQVEELSKVKKDGKYLFTIGSNSHTRRPPGLQNLTGAALKYELEVSKELIELHTGRPCTAFSLPYGRLPENVDEFYSLAEELGYEIIRSSRRRNINIETDWLFNLPCLALYDFTEPDYIGAFNQNPVPTPFFDPVQDINVIIDPLQSLDFYAPITGIELAASSGQDRITIEVISDNKELINSVSVNYTPPQDHASIHIKINEGKYGTAKISLKVSAPGAHPSSGYFYVNVRQYSYPATILLYQGLTEDCPKDIYQKRKDRFYNDMEYIRDNFDVISLLELQDIIENQRVLERKTVVITFEDGLKSCYTIAKPILEKFGFPATFFVVTDWLGDKDYMTWEQVKELSKVTKNGEYLFTIGSHSLTHSRQGWLNQNLTGAALKRELEESKRLIDDRIAPRICTAFSVPYGVLPEDQNGFRDLAVELKYKTILTSKMGNVDIRTVDLLNLPCLPLYDFTEPDYIGAFNKNPLHSPFFDPVQDVFLVKQSYIEVPVTGIGTDAPFGIIGLSIDADSDNKELIKSVRVDYTPRQDRASIHVEINEGHYGSAKISLKLSLPGAHQSSGYFYVHVLAEKPHATILLYQDLTENSPKDFYQKRKDRFYNDMMYIKEHFDVISLLELQKIIEDNRPLLRNTVVITFDDGLKSAYTIAMPILKELGFPATFFVITDSIGSKNYMTWDQVKKLSQEPSKDGGYLFTIGSHSKSHIYPGGWMNLSEAALKRELEDSKKVIEQHIAPRTCTTFSLPHGRVPYNDDIFFSLAEKLGYEIIRSTNPKNIDIENDWLLYLPCLPLYDFTEPDYIGAFNQNPIPTPFFDPVQDFNIRISSSEQSQIFYLPISGIELSAPSGNDGISINAFPENNVLIKNVTVDYTPPRNRAALYIEVNKGVSGSAKVYLKMSAPEAHPSTGYFYVNIEQILTSISEKPTPNGMYLFPNPAQDRIEIFNADETAVHKIFNSGGSLVLSGSGNKIDVSAFPHGVYIVAVHYGKNESTTLIFVKN